MNAAETALRQAVAQAALGWLGTPYHSCHGEPGAGVDCAFLIVRAMQAAGALPAEFAVPAYAPQWHLHRGEELYLQAVTEHCAALESPQALQQGDVVMWQVGRTYSHAALVITPTAPHHIVHALARVGRVTTDPLHCAALLKYPMRCFSPLAYGRA